MRSIQREVDVCVLPAAQQFAEVSAAFRALPENEFFVLVSEHDPRAFYHQLAMEAPGSLRWHVLAPGPPRWRVEVGHARPKEDETEIVAFFERDHEEIDLMLDFLRHDVQAAIDKERRTTAPIQAEYQEFVGRLDRHLRWEEQVLFPAVERKQPHVAHGPGLVIRSQHAELRRLALRGSQHLREGNPTRDGLHELARAIDAIAQLLAAHNRTEEAVYYPVVASAFSSEESSGILQRVRATA